MFLRQERLSLQCSHSTNHDVYQITYQIFHDCPYLVVLRARFLERVSQVMLYLVAILIGEFFIEITIHKNLFFVFIWCWYDRNVPLSKRYLQSYQFLWSYWFLQPYQFLWVDYRNVVSKGLTKMKMYLFDFCEFVFL